MIGNFSMYSPRGGFLCLVLLIASVWGAVALGLSAAPAELVTLRLVPVEGKDYLVDMRPARGPLVAKVVYDGETANETRVINITKPIRIEETTDQPMIMLPRRTPNTWLQAGTPRVSPILIRIPKGSLRKFDPGPYMEYGKWLY